MTVAKWSSTPACSCCCWCSVDFTRHLWTAPLHLWDWLLSCPSSLGGCHDSHTCPEAPCPPQVKDKWSCLFLHPSFILCCFSPPSAPLPYFSTTPSYYAPSAIPINENVSPVGIPALYKGSEAQHNKTFTEGHTPALNRDKALRQFFLKQD